MAHVLIADDDEDTRYALRELLEDAGHVVVAECGDGAACLDLLRASPDSLVVLLDYRMPRLDGTEVLRAVAADSALAACHAFVLLTASPRAARPVVGLPGWPPAPVVGKPFDLTELLEAVAEAERRLRLRRETAS